MTKVYSTPNQFDVLVFTSCVKLLSSVWLRPWKVPARKPLVYLNAGQKWSTGRAAQFGCNGHGVSQMPLRLAGLLISSKTLSILSRHSLDLVFTPPRGNLTPRAGSIGASHVLSVPVYSVLGVAVLHVTKMRYKFIVLIYPSARYD